MENVNQNINTKLYDAYYVVNEPGKKILLPKSCYGAIGITIDENVSGVAHKGLAALNQMSLDLQQIESNDPNTGREFRKFMHAFVVTNQFDPTTLSVCEAVKEGVTSAEIKIGDSDWTSMVLFIPKDLRIAEKIGKNATSELKPDESGRRASYAFGAGIQSLFATKTAGIQDSNTEVIAYEMADLIKGRSIRGSSGGAKETVCSQLAMRILRASLLEAMFTERQLENFSKKEINIIDLRTILKTEMLRANSPVSELYLSSQIFHHEANIEALPFELYRTLMKESDYHAMGQKLDLDDFHIV
jgi:hypothetical protein